MPIVPPDWQKNVFDLCAGLVVKRASRYGRLHATYVLNKPGNSVILVPLYNSVSSSRSETDQEFLLLDNNW